MNDLGRFTITMFWSSEQGRELLRANYFSHLGASSKTCMTSEEAMGFIAKCKARASQ